MGPDHALACNALLLLRFYSSTRNVGMWSSSPCVVCVQCTSRKAALFIVRSQWARERIARAERRPHGPGVRPIGLWCSRHVQRLSPIRATRTWRAAVDPTTSAFHLDPGAFLAQKRHIRLAWDHCKPSRLSSYPGILRFRWPGYRFETRWPPVGHIDAHSRWQMSRCTARRALVAPSAAPAACSQVIRATCQRRARRASARHATWPQEASLAASLAPGQVCDPRPVPARSLRWPPWSPGTHAQYPTSLAHLRCRLSSGPHC